MVWFRSFIVALISFSVSSAVPSIARADVPQDYGYDFATIGAVNNPAYGGNQYGLNAGRGSVAYQYRIAKTEVTTGDWLEFFNTFTTQSQELYQYVQGNTGYMATRIDINYNGPGYRHVLEPTVPNAARVPVQGMSWRLAALYCNWLQHDKSSDWQTIQTGAYDARTFGFNSKGFTDQLTRSADAKYWIPSLDEWLKAVYYDPRKEGVGGWWSKPNASDTELISGFPGQGQTSAGLIDPLEAPKIPVGSYPDVLTPWGLLDASGGAAEWTEGVDETGFRRTVAGSYSRSVFDTRRLDDPGFQEYSFPTETIPGLRLASAIPTPATFTVMWVGVLCTIRRKRP